MDNIYAAPVGLEVFGGEFSVAFVGLVFAAEQA